MNKQLTIALVAHDHRKADMVDWAKFNAEFLSHHHLVCTGTTGGLIKKAFEEAGINADIQCMNSGPMGGDAEIAAMVVRNEIDLAVFIISMVIFFQNSDMSVARGNMIHRPTESLKSLGRHLCGYMQ